MTVETSPLPMEALSSDEEASFDPVTMDFFVEVLSGEEQGVHPLRETMVIGSGSDADLRLPDTHVSRRHAKLERGPRGVWVKDLDSRNGIFFNGARVEGLLVRRETLITIGTTLVRIAGVEHVGSERRNFGDAVGESQPMQDLFATLRRAAPTSANVLLLGETGSGKDVLARAIHVESARRHRPFVVVDCGSLSPSLIESELFGHARGAFTGANTDRQGAFLSATGGTVFLDELGELPLALQPRLLRALENRTVRRLGEDKERPVDVRFIAATNRDLKAMAQKGDFREDLFYRLAVVTARVPPLRERRSDIPLLVSTMLAKMGRPDVTLSASFLETLRQHPWPGNVRELRNVVERAVHGTGDDLVPAKPRTASLDVPYKEAKEQLIESFTREYFTRLFEANGRSVSAMAKAAGVARTYAHELVKKYGLK